MLARLEDKGQDMGFTFRAGALAYRISEGAYDVYCVTCSQGIGTMSPATLAGAIMHNLDRGGVRCQECRQGTCQHCYVLVGDDLKMLFMSRGGGKSEVKKVCTLCRLELELEQSLPEVKDRRLSPTEEARTLSDFGGRGEYGRSDDPDSAPAQDLLEDIGMDFYPGPAEHVYEKSLSYLSYLNDIENAGSEGGDE